MTRMLFMRKSRLLLAMIVCAWALAGSARSEGEGPGMVASEFIYEDAGIPSCHASTIVQTRSGLVAAWFGGTREGALDVTIWMSRHDGQKWSVPAVVADGVFEKEGRRYPCWNPVLFQPRYGPLLLFYRVGPSPSSWWGAMKYSDNDGQTWSKAKDLPAQILGPIRNKPVELVDGTILCGSSTEDAGWRVHMERTKVPLRGEWTRTEPLNTAMEFGAIQPTILVHKPERIQILCRSKQGRILQAWSEDSGFTWSSMERTELPNPNSAIDAAKLLDGRFALVYNHTPRGRGKLNLAMSKDGKTWSSALALEDQRGDEYSYPAIIQTSDGLLHVTYTWNRKKIKHVVVDPFKVETREMAGGEWR